MPAPKVVNWEDGSDARYDTSQMWADGSGALTDGTYRYDGEGRPLDAIPGGNNWTDGLPGARGGGSSGGGGGAPAGSNDLYSAAVSSPWYQQALAANQAAETADSAARKAAIQQALIQFGLVPEGFTDKYGDVDDTVRNLAQQNTSSGISAIARLQQALQDAQRNSSRQLAAKGLRRSGARGYQMRKNQLGYDQSYSDAVNQLLGGINKTYGDFAQGQYNRSMSLAQALQSAIGNMSSYMPRFTSSSPSSYSAPSAPTYYQSAAGPSPYAPTSTGGVGGNQPGYYTGGALYATQSENPNINSNFWFK